MFGRTLSTVSLLRGPITPYCRRQFYYTNGPRTLGQTTYGALTRRDEAQLAPSDTKERRLSAPFAVKDKRRERTPPTRFRGEFFAALSGVASIVLGVLLAAIPLAGLLVWVWLIGAYAVAFGFLSIAFAFRIRKASHAGVLGDSQTVPLSSNAGKSTLFVAGASPRRRRRRARASRGPSATDEHIAVRSGNRARVVSRREETSCRRGPPR
jgi:hypothetical protein